MHDPQAAQTHRHTQTHKSLMQDTHAATLNRRQRSSFQFEKLHLLSGWVKEQRSNAEQTHATLRDALESCTGQ